VPGFGVLTGEVLGDVFSSPSDFVFHPVGFTNTSQEDVRLWSHYLGPVVVPAGSSWTADEVPNGWFEVYLSQGSSFAQVAASCIPLGSMLAGTIDVIAEGMIVE
jgi:hypothetical protein